MAYGYRAMIKLLQNYRKLNGCRTISDFINRWAPSVENNTSGYISRVCREMQVPSNYVPDVNDRGTMCVCSCHVTSGKRHSGSDGRRTGRMGPTLS